MAWEEHQPVRIINGGNTHIVLNRIGDEWKASPWIFPEAWAVLKELPAPPGALFDASRDGGSINRDGN